MPRKETRATIIACPCLVHPPLRTPTSATLALGRNQHNGKSVNVRFVVSLTMSKSENVEGMTGPQALRDWQVLRVSREAEAAGGDEFAVLHNMATSLSLACAVLCAFSAYAVVSRNARVMVRATAYEAVVATSLALCGVLLFGSSALLAAGGQQIRRTVVLV